MIGVGLFVSCDDAFFFGLINMLNVSSSSDKSPFFPRLAGSETALLGFSSTFGISSIWFFLPK